MPTIIDMIRKKRLQWFGHMNRLPSTSFVHMSYKEDFDGTRPKGRPPKRWSDQIREDTGLPLLTAERYCQDRERWKKVSVESVAKLHGVCS